MPTHITVTAPQGRKTPINRTDGVDPESGQLFVEHGFVRRVRYSQDVRRALGRGDLLACTMDGAPVDSIELANAPDDIPGGKVIIGQAMAKKGPTK